MWGFISTEASYQTNFNTSFSTTRSDVLIHLAQWQYWWWFWFAFLWSFYYLLVNKIVRFRSLKMKPKISTSYRPHGKWGDFLAAIVPIIWCMNILTNSNFILRLIEWQYENNLFCIRIRARQWYWVYKIDLKNFFNISNINKNIGSNKWLSNYEFSNQLFTEKNTSLLNNKISNKNLLVFWNDYTQKVTSVKKNNMQIYMENNMRNKYKYNLFLNIKSNFNQNYFLHSKQLTKLNSIFYKNKIHSSQFFFAINNKNSLKNFIFNINVNTINFFDSLENSRILKRNFNGLLPLRLIKNNLIVDKKLSIFLLKFNNNNNYLNIKENYNSNFFVIKQKKYTKKNTMLSLNLNDVSKNIYLLDNKIFLNEKNNIFTNYKLIKKNKKHSDIIPTTLNKRLLRTKKTLVIPAHINISLITSSFDIVHSWFIPGLGLKLDCVPGRSTHHTFYVDNVGFYYGQCAEICGRYHHHMPIRLCALPFEHFLIWWQNFGLLKILNFKNKNKNIYLYSFRKFCW